MIDAETESQVHSALARLQPAWHPRDVDELVPMPAGLSNANFALRHRGERFVLRLARRGVSGAIERRSEYDLLSSRLARVSAPLVAYALPEGDLLTRFVPGALLVDASAHPAMLASYVAGLHARLRPFGWHHPLPELVHAWFESAADAGATIIPAWRDGLAQLRPEDAVGPCHNDLNPWNVIVTADSPRRWCTLDWEWCGDHMPLFDVVALCEGLGLADAATSEVVGRYLHLRDQRAADPARLDDLRLRFQLRECAWAHAAAARFGARVELDEQILRSSAALDRLLR